MKPKPKKPTLAIPNQEQSRAAVIAMLATQIEGITPDLSEQNSIYKGIEAESKPSSKPTCS
jgi:hypothetical protein